MTCECGCGAVPNTGKRFVHGHHVRINNPMSHAESRERVAASKRAEKHWRWQGDRANYKALHLWLNRNWPRSGTCEECGLDVGTAKGAGTQWANIGATYTRDRSQYRELCPKCHFADDGAERIRKRQATVNG